VNRSLLLACLLATPCANGAQPPDTASLLTKMAANHAQLQDYTCEISRQELFKGKQRELPNVVFKYKRPARYYMKWPDDGIEAIYVEGKYDNRMVIHGGLLFSFASVAVDPKVALNHGRHTLPEADLGNIIKIFEDNTRRASKDPEAKIAYDGDEDLEGRPAWRFKAVFPPNKGYYGHVVRVHVDQHYVLPVRIEVRGWQNELLESYRYSSLKRNVGLSEADFDVKNPAYMFRLGNRAVDSNEPR